eukprot:31764-Chlamydomonas_euryale.AAC.1
MAASLPAAGSMLCMGGGGSGGVTAATDKYHGEAGAARTAAVCKLWRRACRRWERTHRLLGAPREGGKGAVAG